MLSKFDILAEFPSRVTIDFSNPFLDLVHNMSRREKIEALLEDDPQDQFLRYSLAMELAKEGEHERSQTLFANLREDQPPYVPAFFMAAQHLVDLERTDEARELLTAGVTAAEQQGDLHAAGEMREFLLTLG